MRRLNAAVAKRVAGMPRGGRVGWQSDALPHLLGRTIDEAAIASAERALASDIMPIDDLRSTARYRMKVACNLLREFLQSAQHVQTPL